MGCGHLHGEQRRAGTSTRSTAPPSRVHRQNTTVAVTQMACRVCAQSACHRGATSGTGHSRNPVVPEAVATHRIPASQRSLVRVCLLVSGVPGVCAHPHAGTDRSMSAGLTRTAPGAACCGPAGAQHHNLPQTGVQTCTHSTHQSPCKHPRRCMCCIPSRACRLDALGFRTHGHNAPAPACHAPAVPAATSARGMRRCCCVQAWPSNPP